MKVHIGKYPKNPNKQRKVSIQIDPWDTWNMDTTLALIIVPMLKQLRDQKQGAPFVENEDVPEHLQHIRDENAPWDSTDDPHWFARWEWVLNEMIFAFESKLTDWEGQFWKSLPELDFTEHPEDVGKDVRPIRFTSHGECDNEGMIAYEKRIQNGFRLFGKYYSGLWT
jgi:hypothetical protein